MFVPNINNVLLILVSLITKVEVKDGGVDHSDMRCAHYVHMNVHIRYQTADLQLEVEKKRVRLLLLETSIE